MWNMKLLIIVAVIVYLGIFLISNWISNSTGYKEGYIAGVMTHIEIVPKK